MKLVLAEKPSVAQSLAKVLGVTNRQDGYLEGNGYIVSWCVGHLVELAQPEAYDERYGKWTYGDLPILPDDWKYEVSAGTRKQFGILKKLMARDDVVSLVCATVPSVWLFLSCTGHPACSLARVYMPMAPCSILRVSFPSRARG